MVSSIWGSKKLYLPHIFKNYDSKVIIGCKQGKSMGQCSEIVCLIDNFNCILS